MQIVIEIPDTLKIILDSHDIITASHPMWVAIMMDAIANGTPLPKGHGALKDVDHYTKMAWEHPDYSLMDDEPTIIEADTESEE